MSSNRSETTPEDTSCRLVWTERRKDKAFERKPPRGRAQGPKTRETASLLLNTIVARRVYERPHSKGLESRFFVHLRKFQRSQVKIDSAKA